MRYFIIALAVLLSACGTSISKTTETTKVTVADTTINGIPTHLETTTTTNLVNGDISQTQVATSTTNPDAATEIKTETVTTKHVSESTDSANTTTKVVKTTANEIQVKTVTRETTSGTTSTTTKVETTTKTLVTPETIETTVTPSNGSSTKTTTVADQASQTVTQKTTTIVSDSSNSNAPVETVAVTDVYTEVGVWEYTYPSSSCVETWIIRPDESFKSTSSNETIIGHYTLSDTANTSGLFIFELFADSVDGAPDCGGNDNTSLQGRSAIYYVKKLSEINKFEAYTDNAGNNLAFKFDLTN